VPSVCRRIVVLLVVALLSVGAGVGGSVSAHAQGAGDQQYQDPFGGDDSGSGNGDNSSSGSNSGSSGSSDSGGDVEPLTPAPQTSGGSGSSGSGSASGSGTASGTTAGTATTAPAATLPNTGLDTRVLLLGGAVLVLLGVGLRLRNAPERF
jgi:LPXTG-motif cell wall-anchored protein